MAGSMSGRIFSPRSRPTSRSRRNGRGSRRSATRLRITQHADGSETDEARYYILSRYLSGKRFSEAVRGHWGIESMHWVLDVNFREDDSRTRERTLGNNLSWLRRFAVTLLKRHPAKDSLRGKMIRCMMNTEFLTEVLTFNDLICAGPDPVGNTLAPFGPAQTISSPKAGRKNNFYKLVLVNVAEDAMTCACKMQRSRHGFTTSFVWSPSNWTSGDEGSGRRRKPGMLGGAGFRWWLEPPACRARRSWPD